MLEDISRMSKGTEDLLQLLGKVTDGFYLLDRQWRFTYIDEKAAKIIPIMSDMLGKIIWNEFPSWKETTIYQELSQARKIGQSLSFEIPGLLQGKHVELTAYPFDEGIAIVMHDNSELERSKTENCQSHELMLKIFNASPAIMSIKRISDCRIVAVNEAWLSTLGFKYCEVVGRTVQELDIMVGNWSNVWPYRNSKCLMPYQIRTRLGEMKDVLVRLDEIDFADEKCILCSCIDVTKVLHIEKELFRLDRLNIIGEMSAGLAHEVRNPLTTVKGFLQMFQVKKEFSAYKEYLNVMLDELDRTNGIISEFLSLAKNKMIVLKNCNLNNIINSLYPLMQADAIICDRSVDIDLGNIPDVLLDENEIRQCILNLVRNGFEAMKAGGKVGIKTYKSKDYVVLEVRDNGCGMPPEILEKLGTPFLTTKEKGTGLGLPICYRIAERHNAKLEVESNPAGTAFSFRFPIG